jgi:hypothetical protein
MRLKRVIVASVLSAGLLVLAGCPAPETPPEGTPPEPYPAPPQPDPRPTPGVSPEPQPVPERPPQPGATATLAANPESR